MGSKVGNIAKNYLRGRLRCAEFAITNCCVSQCAFCGIWKQQPKVFVNRDKALAAIDRMADLGVSHLTLTGGEPLLHPNIADFVARASKRNVHNAVLDAAPRLLTRNGILKKLEAAGCDLISISFDSGDPEIMAASRKIDNIMDDMAAAMDMIAQTPLKTMASVLIWNDNYDKLGEVCEKAVRMGFDMISLNYPTFSQSDVYELGGDGISLSRENVVSALTDAIALKKSKKYPIINSARSMANIINYLKDPAAAKFGCFGGSRVLFVDWFFNAHPCMQLPDTLGNILDMREADLNCPVCNGCNMSWYRDFSMFFHGAKSIPAVAGALGDAARLAM